MRNRVRELRTERAMTQAQLADSMAVSRQTINSIEAERYTPSLPLAMALARFFDCTVEEMFDDDENRRRGDDTALAGTRRGGPRRRGDRDRAHGR